MATGWGRQVRRDFQGLVRGDAALKTYTTPNAALTTVNPADDGQGNVTPGTTEPSVTGGYARQGITWSATAQPANDAAAVLTNSVAISWGPSSVAYSTGATALGFIAIYNTSVLATNTEAAFLGRAAIAVPQAVNSAGITLTLAISALTMGVISA